MDRDKRLLVIRGTDQSRDRDGDIIMLRGWNVENYLKNPVFLWAHDYKSVPIGAAEKVVRRRDKEDPHMLFHIRFPSKDTPMKSLDGKCALFLLVNRRGAYAFLLSKTSSRESQSLRND